MVKDEKTQLIKLYEDLKDSLDLINENVPALQQLYKNTWNLQEAYKKKLDAGVVKNDKDLKTLQKQISDTTKSFNEKIQELNDSLLVITNTVSSLNASIPDFSSQMEKLIKENKSLSIRIDKMEKLQAILTEIVKRDEPVQKNSEKKSSHARKKVKIDYDQITTVADLFEQYSNKLDDPIIVKRKSWSNNYCAVVSNVFSDGNFEADAYLNGMFNRHYPNYKSSAEFQMYEPDKKAEILEDYYKRNASES